jgi:hypothetical protein
VQHGTFSSCDAQFEAPISHGTDSRPADDTDALEREARAFCPSLDLEWVRGLRASARKQTVVAEVGLPDGRAAVLKFRNTTSVGLSSMSSAFETERRFYEASSFELAPQLLASDTRFLVLERIAGVTLREWLRTGPIDGVRLRAQLLRIVDALAAGRYRGNLAHSELAARRGSDRIYNLLISGPVDGRRSRFGHSAASQVSRFCVPWLRHALVYVHRRWATRGVQFASEFGHNDLHPNNVITNENGPYVVDYECVTRPGFWIIDVLYLLGTTYAALKDPGARNHLLSAIVARLYEHEPLLGPELVALARLFASAALSNGRFRGTTWYDHNNIASLLRLLKP